MTTSMYCLYVGFDYTYIDMNALAQGIKWFQTVACVYVCMCVCMHACACMYVCVCVLYVCLIHKDNRNVEKEGTNQEKEQYKKKMVT